MTSSCTCQFPYFSSSRTVNTPWGEEINTADETGVLPNASLKSQLVMQEKELRIKKVHALLPLNSSKVFFFF